MTLRTDSSSSRKSLRGFASLSPERRSEIASLGGLTAHKMGRAHQWTPAEAAEAGRKGGSARAAAKQQRAARG